MNNYDTGLAEIMSVHDDGEWRCRARDLQRVVEVKSWSTLEKAIYRAMNGRWMFENLDLTIGGDYISYERREGRRAKADFFLSERAAHIVVMYLSRGERVKEAQEFIRTWHSGYVPSE